MDGNMDHLSGNKKIYVYYSIYFYFIKAKLLKYLLNYFKGKK